MDRSGGRQLGVVRLVQELMNPLSSRLVVFVDDGGMTDGIRIVLQWQPINPVLREQLKPFFQSPFVEQMGFEVEEIFCLPVAEFHLNALNAPLEP